MITKDYLIEASNLRSKIKEGEATWIDMQNLRIKYGENPCTPDSLRRAYSMYDIFNDSGWVKLPIELKEGCTTNYSETTILEKDGKMSSDKLIELSEIDKSNPDTLMKAHGFDPNLYELISARNVIWNVQKKDCDDVKNLYSSRIYVKPKNEEKKISDLTLEDMQKFLGEFIDSPKSKIDYSIKVKNSQKLLEVNICDLHLGKLGFREETGEDYNTKIAVERFKYLITDLMSQVNHLDFEKIIFVWSNDFYHYDTCRRTTTAGTPQDSDKHWGELFRVGTELLVWAINEMKKKAPVLTFYVGSNHDKQVSYYALNFLSAWYRNDNDVVIDTSCRTRKIIEYGNCMLGYAHGDSEGSRISTILVKEEPEIFGRTKFRYLHCGHFHSKKTPKDGEKNGCEVRYLGSPTGADAWHYEQGFIGAVKCGYAFVYDKTLGQRLEVTSNII